jgi:TolB-like protein
MADLPTELGQGAGPWERLYRRKVVQWGLLYAAGAWGLLQGIAYMRDTFGWPAYLQQSATVLLLIGLPIVLVLAWFHGDRGHRQVKAGELVILAGLFLLGAGLFWYFHRASENASSTIASPDARLTPEFASDASIAVLPFVNMSSDKEQEYFADGISEELLNLLAKIPELRVIARTSSFSFKGKDIAIDEIARALNVANVLEGSVRRSGETLRITAQLVRASDSSHLWSQTYDRDLTDIFAVQDEIAASVVQQLKIRLLGAAPKVRATDARAYALHLQAEALFRQFTKSALEESIALNEQALAIDPEYTAAWVGLANLYIAQIGEGFRPANEGVRLAHEFTAKALSIDPAYAPAHATLGGIAQLYDRDLALAAKQIERASALEPTNLDILDVAGSQARRLGRLQQAIEIQEYLVDRDPVNEFAYNELGKTYRYAGRLDEAITAFRTALRLNPLLVDIHMPIAEVLLQQGDATGALAEAE